MLTWTTVKVFFKKFWAWCKKYWQLFVGMAVPILLWAITRDRNKSPEMLDRVIKDHEKEIDAIERSYELERLQKERAKKRYEDIVSKIEARSDAALIQLDKKKKDAIKKLLEDNPENSENVTNKLAEILGFEVILDD